MSLLPQQVSDPYSGYSIEAADNDIAAIINIITARYKIILSCFIIAAGLAFFYVSSVQSQYTAASQIMITDSQNTRQPNIVQALLSSGSLNIADLLSQIEIIKSPDTVKALIVREELFRMAEIGGNSQVLDFESLPNPIKNKMIRSVLGRLDVQPVLGTSLVNIKYTSSDAYKAASVANMIITIYSDNEKAELLAQAHTVSDWLAERLEDLKTEVHEAETALENQKNEINTFLTESQDSRLIQIELLTQQLARAEAIYASTQAKISKIKDLEKTDQRLDVLTDVSSNRLIENLKVQQSGLLRKRASLALRYGPNHPEMKALRGEMIALDDKINQEIDKSVLALEHQASIDQNSINELKANMAQYRKSYHGDAQGRRVIRELETRTESARTLLNSFMASYLESQQRLNIDKNPVRVITHASIPLSPTFPKKSLIIMLSGITGLFMGVFLALVIERIQNVFQNPRQVEQYTNLPVYGVLPVVKNIKKQNPAEYILNHPASGVAELVRSLYMSVHLRDPHHKSGGRVITMTSTTPNEGKTTTATWLAATAAQGGEKVLIIDGDMRRPSLHKSFDIGNAKGLVDYLSDRLSLDEVIYKKHSSGAHVMTSKAVPTHALTLLTSERMDSMIRRLRDMYDLIIIDAPTSMVFSDSRVLAKISDKTLYVVESQKTRRDTVLNTLKQFTDMNYDNIAIILNKSNMNGIIDLKGDDLAYLYQMNTGKKS
jgi:succinoglycan biosynthesis transport protein ExoP